MNTEEQIKKLSRKSIFGVKKATKLGDSYGLILPKTWFTHACTEIDGEYYFMLKMGSGKSIICQPIEPSDLQEE